MTGDEPVAPPPGLEGKTRPTYASDSPIRSVKDLLLQLATITAGVLIALLLEGLVGWNSNRLLVNEARKTIRQEIADNKTALDRHLEGVEARLKELEHTVKWATERLNTGKSDMQASIGFSASPLSSAAWETAARTGALAHMAYSEVQKYASVYSVQALYAARQLRTLERVTSAISFANDDVTAKELELLHQEVIQIGGDLYMEREIGRGLSVAYDKLLKE